MKNTKKIQTQNSNKLKLGRRVVRILTEAELGAVTGGTHTLDRCPTQREPTRADE